METALYAIYLENKQLVKRLWGQRDNPYTKAVIKAKMLAMRTVKIDLMDNYQWNW